MFVNEDEDRNEQKQIYMFFGQLYEEKNIYKKETEYKNPQISKLNGNWMHFGHVSLIYIHMYMYVYQPLALIISQLI